MLNSDVNLPIIQLFSLFHLPMPALFNTNDVSIDVDVILEADLDLTQILLDGVALNPGSTSTAMVRQR